MIKASPRQYLLTTNVICPLSHHNILTVHNYDCFPSKMFPQTASILRAWTGSSVLSSVWPITALEDSCSDPLPTVMLCGLWYVHSAYSVPCLIQQTNCSTTLCSIPTPTMWLPCQTTLSTCCVSFLATATKNRR